MLGMCLSGEETRCKVSARVGGGGGGYCHIWAI